MDKHGFHVDLAKIQAIRNWPTLTNLIELRRFLDLASFNHRFVLGLSHIVWALIQAMKGGSKAWFIWTKSQYQEFEELKQHLCSFPILTLPDLQQPFNIKIDASDYAIGAILT